MCVCVCVGGSGSRLSVNLPAPTRPAPAARRLHTLPLWPAVGKVCGRVPGGGWEPGGSRKVWSLCRPHTHTHMQYCYTALREDYVTDIRLCHKHLILPQRGIAIFCVCVCVCVWAAEAPDFP